MDNNTGSGFLARLNPRERKLLVLWALSMGLMLTFLVGWFGWSSITEKADAAQSYQLTLDVIAQKQQAFLSKQGQSDQEDIHARIEGNEIKLQSYLDREANKHSLKITNFKESSVPLGGKGRKEEGGGIVEESLTITLDDAEFRNLGRFMDALARSKELLVVKRIDLERARTFATDGKFRVTMTISTYKKEAA